VCECEDFILLVHGSHCREFSLLLFGSTIGSQPYSTIIPEIVGSMNILTFMLMDPT